MPKVRKEEPTYTLMLPDFKCQSLIKGYKVGMEDYQKITGANVHEALGYFRQLAKNAAELMETAKPTKREFYYQEDSE